MHRSWSCFPSGRRPERAGRGYPILPPAGERFPRWAGRFCAAGITGRYGHPTKTVCDEAANSRQIHTGNACLATEGEAQHDVRKAERPDQVPDGRGNKEDPRGSGPARDHPAGALPRDRQAGGSVRGAALRARPDGRPPHRARDYGRQPGAQHPSGNRNRGRQGPGYRFRPHGLSADHGGSDLGVRRPARRGRPVPRGLSRHRTQASHGKRKRRHTPADRWRKRPALRGSRCSRPLSPVSGMPGIPEGRIGHRRPQGSSAPPWAGDAPGSRELPLDRL